LTSGPSLPDQSRQPARKLNLRLLAETAAVCRLSASSPIPAWAVGGAGFFSITRTTDELSIVCAANQVPGDVRCEKAWRILQMEGPFDFALTGVLLSVAAPLNEAGISILALSTYDTDYVLVKEDHAERAIQALIAAGHSVQEQ
jgi:hypothetical protein